MATPPHIGCGKYLRRSYPLRVLYCNFRRGKTSVNVGHPALPDGAGPAATAPRVAQTQQPAAKTIAQAIARNAPGSSISLLFDPKCDYLGVMRRSCQRCGFQQYLKIRRSLVRVHAHSAEQ